MSVSATRRRRPGRPRKPSAILAGQAAAQSQPVNPPLRLLSAAMLDGSTTKMLFTFNQGLRDDLATSRIEKITIVANSQTLIVAQGPFVSGSACICTIDNSPGATELLELADGWDGFTAIPNRTEFSQVLIGSIAPA